MTPEQKQTLQQCKDKIARQHNQPDWDRLLSNTHSINKIDRIADKVAELYRQSAISDLHNKIMTQWARDYGSVDREQYMDAYTVSGFIQEALKSNP